MSMIALIVHAFFFFCLCLLGIYLSQINSLVDTIKKNIFNNNKQIKKDQFHLSQY